MAPRSANARVVSSTVATKSEADAAQEFLGRVARIGRRTSTPVKLTDQGGRTVGYLGEVYKGSDGKNTIVVLPNKVAPNAVSPGERKNVVGLKNGAAQLEDGTLVTPTLDTAGKTTGSGSPPDQPTGELPRAPAEKKPEAKAITPETVGSPSREQAARNSDGNPKTVVLVAEPLPPTQQVAPTTPAVRPTPSRPAATPASDPTPTSESPAQTDAPVVPSTAPPVDLTPPGQQRDPVGRSGTSLALNTPKYVRGTGVRKDGYRETMARLFLWLNDEERSRAYAAAPPETKDLFTKIAAGSRYEKAGYIEFLLQEADAAFADKVIPLSGQADQFANYAFGANATIYTFRAVLLNNRQDNQAANMFRLYQHILRAYQTARMRIEVHMLYDQTLVTGTITNFQWTLNGADESACPCTFQMVARNVIQNYGVQVDPYVGWDSPTTPVDAAVLNGVSVNVYDPQAAPWVYRSAVILLPPRSNVPGYTPGQATAPEQAAPAHETVAQDTTPQAKATFDISQATRGRKEDTFIP